MAIVNIPNWDEKNIASVGTLSDSSSFTGLTKVQPVKITWGNASTSTGSGDAAFTVDINSQSELVITQSDESTTRNYEVAYFDDTAQEAWIWVYGSWDSDGSNQIVVGAGTGDGTDYSMSGTGVNPWSQTGINASMVQHFDSNPLSANDSTVNNNQGSISGPVYTNTPLGGGADHNGTSDFINFNGGGIVSNSPHTMLVTARPRNVSRSNVIYAEGQAGARSTIRIGSDGSIGGRVNNSGALSTSYSASVGTDYNIAITSTSTDHFLYVDGNQENTSAQGPDSNNGSNYTGKNWFSGTDYFDGFILDLRTYTEPKNATWMQAEHDASPKAGQTFFSWNGAEDTVSTGTLSGRVTDSSGSAVANAEVYIINTTDSDPGNWTVLEKLSTDANGNYTSSPITTGTEVHVVAQIPNATAADAEGKPFVVIQ